LPSATIGIRPHERQLWRVVNAAGHRHFDLAVPGSRLYLVALDGVPLGFAGYGVSQREVAHVLLPPGSRTEFIVDGPPAPRYLVSRCYDAGPNGDVNPYVVLGELVDGAARTLPVRAADAEAGVREPLPPAAFAGAVLTRRQVTFTEDARGFYINGLAYDPARGPMFTARAGTLEEWTLVNRTDEVHVFHLHQVHFWVERDGEDGAPAWRDTVDVPPQHRAPHATTPERVRIIVDLRDPAIAGVFPFHCHIADHEDGGMMATIRVLPPARRS
jgi:FtsP/CotA-like multicopper oxidase with cupredoxin domain